jgi:AcrR family transcriptional regulator
LTSNTEQKILTGARQCFFRHGYKASNMTLISEYAGFSRATTHKHFKNKDDAFRQVLMQVKQQANEACQPIMENNLECWTNISLIVQIWLKPTFEEAGDQRIINDLKYHVQQVAEDIFQQARQDIADMLYDLLTKAEKKNDISLDKTGLEARELARLLLASLDGIRGHLEKQRLEQASHDILHIFQLACRS